ncbi:zona pellucida sperm-binding protein 3-like [Rhinoderma darwinii]|uniref:zona pellucida sperm-binding protein 3-like n=1 Tax=Rhinoderma darwinii TaxID=43563 RepID=UPI003F6650C5
MVVTVRRDLFGNGKLVKVSDLSLGSESCAPGPQNTDAVVNFEIGLQECGNRVQMTADLLIYTTTLNYSPTANRNSPIIRTNSATISIQCNYPRHGNVSSKAVKPTWLPFSTTISLEERLSFSLLLMNDDWSAPRSSSIFSLGETFYIEATLDLGNHIDMTLFADSCVATLSPDVSSVPRYEIIGLYGCLLDGKQEDSSSAFRSPRSQQNKLQFMVDAFRFTNSDLSTIYITCNLRAAPASQAPDPVNKACSFDKTRNTWISLDGPNNICACCESGVCAPSGGQSRRLFDYYPWSRRIGKRTVEETLQATLGPLYLINNNPYKSLSHQEEPQTMTVGRWTLLASGIQSEKMAVGLRELGVHISCGRQVHLASLLPKRISSDDYNFSSPYLCFVETRSTRRYKESTISNARIHSPCYRPYCCQTPVKFYIEREFLPSHWSWLFNVVSS